MSAPLLCVIISILAILAMLGTRRKSRLWRWRKISDESNPQELVCYTRAATHLGLALNIGQVYDCQTNPPRRTKFQGVYMREDQLQFRELLEAECRSVRQTLELPCSA